MDKDISNSSDSVTADSSTPKTQTSVAPPSPSPPQSSDTPQKHQFSADFTKLYHSIFPPKSPVKDSFPVSPSPCSSTSSPDDHQETSNNCSGGTTSTTTTIENRLCQASFVLEYQQLCERYDLCCTHLQDLTDELESLRLDNANLRAANKELAKLLSLSSKSAMQNCLRRLNLLDSSSTGSDLATDELSGYSPTSVMDQCRFERKNPERVALPKSISVRSSSYLKSNQPSTPNNSGSGSARNQLRSRVPSAHDVGKQMYLPGAKEAFEVYNQGMFKTELCNKWQETGACPYGDQCQFAHGIAELRPVIRHPRYKTEVCRMVLAGDSCPYGHRCHFRHSLTEQEMRLSPR